MKKGPQVPRTLTQVEELHQDTIKDLIRDARHFDEGETRKYRQFALSIRKLVYDSKDSTSLLKQLGLSGRKILSSTPGPIPGNSLADCDLIALLVPNAAHGKARATWCCGLDRWPMEFVGFDDWWLRPVMSVPGLKQFSRHDLVMTIANQEAAHADPEIDAAFQRMRTENFRWSNGLHVTEHPDRYAIRTIAHELIKSLNPAYHRRLPQTPGAIWRGVVFAEAGHTQRRAVKAYHATNPNLACPCSSGLNFGSCHGRGAIEPDEYQAAYHQFQAPPNAAFARVRLGVGPPPRR